MSPGDPLELEWVRAQVRHKLFGGEASLRVDRFELRARLGAGAMGAVWAAYDPELAREVAIKMLLDGDGDPERLRREGQAMARLRHPNVVAVHEVGMWRDLPFVAMERVDGPTLRSWLASRRRSVSEILAVLGGAGHGLAAAHAAGLVHRDFKPDNVLVDSSGLARIADFGLARPAESLSPTSAMPAANRALGTLTVHAGTLAYMAPELLRGEPATPRSDQFAFCVTLHEALYGQRPFAGATASELDAAMREGPRTQRGEHPAGGTIPARVRRAVDRGLAADPAHRYPAMIALLAALAPPDRTALWIAGSGLAALGALGAVWIVASSQPTEHVELCGGSEVALGSAWDAARARGVRAAITTAKRPFAGAAAAQTAAILDDYASRWQAMYRASCEATRVHHAQPEDVLALRQDCLHDRRRQLDALTSRLAHSGGELAEVAVRAASGLPSIERCADVAALRQRTPLPSDPKSVAAIGALRDQLATARAAFLAGRYAEALTGAKQVVEGATPIGHAPLTAEAQLLVGQSANRTGDLAGGTAALQRSYEEAIAGSDDSGAADAAIAQTFGVGYLQGKVDEGRRWAGIAEAQVRRSNDGSQRAALANALGNLADSAGSYEEARAAFARAVEAWRSVPGDHRVDLGGALQNEGNVLRTLGRNDEALARLAQAEEVWTGALGAEHPLLAMLSGNVAVALQAAGRLEEALARNQHALEIDRANAGPDDPNVGMSLGGVGVMYLALGRPADAFAQFEQAHAIFEKRFGPEHPLVASTTTNMGLAELRLGRLDAAAKHLTDSLATKEKLRGNSHPSLTTTLEALGELALRRGQAKTALELYRRSLAIGAAALGADSAELAAALIGEGKALLATGDAAGARVALERAVALRAKPGSSPGERGVAAFQLARARFVGGDRSARTAAAAAAALLATAGAAFSDDRAEVATWLAAHP